MEMKPKVVTLNFDKKEYLRLVLVSFLMLSVFGVFGQQNFRPRQNISQRGDVIVTGNTILGLIDNPDSAQGPNGAYNGDNNNGGAGRETAYIDIDGEDDTFSSSSADLINPSPQDCAVITYAGLYWTANYYLARRNTPRIYDGANVTPETIFSGGNSRTVLTINNSDIAQTYRLRASQFGNDDSDIRLSPASSNLVVAQPANGCGITNGADLAGNIAVIQAGGSCSMREKVVNAQNAGAIGVIVVSNKSSSDTKCCKCYAIYYG